MLTEGSVLGERFEVRGVLGRGGMATVYLAHDRVRGQRVALKLLHAHLADDPSSQKRLRRELQAAGLVRHEAALVAHELHDIDGISVLSMPFFNGETLAERVGSGRTLSEPELRAMGTRVAEVLLQAHRMGVLHRDVTPNNVMIDSSGRSVLTDFGLAKVQGAGTKSTTALGTVGYAAPEVYAGDRGDPRSDLYSLGAVLYFAATGQEPFGSANPMGALQRQMAGEHTPLAELRPDLPSDLIETVESLLDPDPNLRPQGAADVRGALSRRRAPERSTGPLPRVEVSQAPRTGTAIQRALPPGRWAVIVSDGDNEGRRQVSRVDRGRDRRSVESMAYRSMLTLWDGLKEALGLGPDAPPEVELAAAVARLSTLPPEALDVPEAMFEKKFRLVDGVSESVARALVEEAKRLGFKARCREAKAPLQGPLGAAAKVKGPAIGLVWGLFGSFVLMGVAELEVLLGAAIGATVGLSFLHNQRTPVWRALPLAFGDDLQEHAAIGYEHVVSAEDESLTRGEELVRRAEVRLQALSAALDESTHLPDPALHDLRTMVIALAEEAAALGEQVDRLEAELAQIEEPADTSWAATRLRRLQTLAAEGEPVDATELHRLEQALAAEQSVLEARGRVESARTAAVAQLLEIAASASRTRLDLLARPEDARVPELVASLRKDADALARARRELASRPMAR